MKGDQLLLPLEPSTSLEICLDHHKDIDDYCIMGKTVYIRLKEKRDSIGVKLALKGFINNIIKFI